MERQNQGVTDEVKTVIAPLPSRWNKGIDLVHIDLRTMDELWDSIERQIKFKRYPLLP